MTYSYNERSQTYRVTNAAGSQTVYNYDNNNNLLSISREQQVLFQFSYDQNNNLIRIEDALSNVTEYTYNSDGQVLTKTSPSGGVTTLEYQNGFLSRVVNPEGVEYTLEYDAAGRLTGVSDVDNHTVTLTYDGMNRVTNVTNPLGHSVGMTYNSQNDLLTFTDPNGNVTRRQYSASGQLLSQINPLGQETRYEYDAEDRLVRVIDSLGRVTQLGYNAAGRLSSITNPLGETQTLETDAAGNLIKRFDAFNRLVTSVEYDSRNNPVSVTDAQSNTTTREFDPQNRLVKTTDPLSRVTSFEYDKLNRVVSSIDALMGESRQAFDTNGNRNLLQDPNGNETSFDFDQSGRLTQETLATGDKVKYTYSARDLLESITNGRGQVRQLEYDAAGRVTRFVDQDGAVSLSYDPNGNVLTVTDSSGTITREYDSLNRVIRYTNQSGNTLQYLYNSVGELVTLIYPDNRQVTYEYDAASRLVKVIDWANRTTTYQYDKNSRLTKTLRPNGTEQTRAYNAASQLTQLKEVNTTTGEIINRFDFSYDAAGNIVEEKTSPEADPDIDLEMIYAAANRLAGYDSNAVQFDADGNMTLGPLSGEMANFVFDSRNRLTQAGDTVYRYNAENQRIGINQTQYVINVQPALSQVLVKKAADGTETFYVYGLGLIGQEQNGDYLSYHFDYRGSTVALTDETGTIVERFLYSPYGLLLNGDASITPFLFNGMYGVMTDDNGLYYMRARYYSPEIRRFVNQDILLGNIFDGQTLNRYAFVTGQPVSFVDPYGLSALVGVWPIAGGILVSDGPLPVGDIIALIIITGAVVYDNVVDSASQCSCNDQETYYHYTSKANLALILESQQLLPSSGPIHARHGGGQYFTDISPEMIAAATISGLTEEQIAAGKISLGQLAQRLFGSAIRRGRKLDTFIEIDLKGCNVVHPIPFIYLVPNDAPLDLTNRIIRFGDVILLPTVR